MSRNVLTLDKFGVKLKKQPKPTLQGIFELIGIKINVTKCPVSCM